MEPYIWAFGIIGEAYRKIFHRLRLGFLARHPFLLASESRCLVVANSGLLVTFWSTTHQSQFVKSKNLPLR